MGRTIRGGEKVIPHPCFWDLPKFWESRRPDSQKSEKTWLANQGGLISQSAAPGLISQPFIPCPVVGSIHSFLAGNSLQIPLKGLEKGRIKQIGLPTELAVKDTVYQFPIRQLCVDEVHECLLFCPDGANSQTNKAILFLGGRSKFLEHYSLAILLTNDDGLGADGLLALERATMGMGPLRVLAPKGALSGCGHQVTNHAEIWWEKGALDHHHALLGTPADCVRIALYEWGRDWSWVFSGINAGGNMGADVPISGTIAAAREAAYHGLRAAAFSQYKIRGLEYDWDRAASWVCRVIEWLSERNTPAGCFWNVNFPHLEKGDPEPAILEASVGRYPLPLEYRKGEKGWLYAGQYHQREREAGSDVAVCFGGDIAVSLISV